MRIIKLSLYAKELGLGYRTLWNRFKKGKLQNAYKDSYGNIFVRVPDEKFAKGNLAIIYTRVSSSQNKKNLDAQVSRLEGYAMARGYKIIEIVKEVGSGVNDNRPKLKKILGKDNYDTIIVEHKDRLTRFGFNYIETLLEAQGKSIDVANEAANDKADLMEDLISVIYSFSARMYGQRRSKRKTEDVVRCIEENLK